MEAVVLNAFLRKDTSKSARNTARKNGLVPGIFYAKKDEPIPIQVTQNSINPLVFTSETHLISLHVEGHEDHECIIKDVQFNPVTDKIIHFDLLGLTKGEKIQLEVPISLQGDAVGIKEGGVLQHLLHKIDIECLPKDIPQHLEVNVTHLGIDDAIQIKDLNFENIDILNAEDAMVVLVSHPKKEKEPTTEDALEEPAEPEVISKGKSSEDE
jgi:large subunit ribosomal protein L25